MRYKFIPIVLIILILFSCSALAFSTVIVIEPYMGQNLTGNIILNATTDGPALNATFYWINETGDIALSTTIYNNTAIDLIFDNNSFDTTVLNDGIYNLTVNATNATGTIVSNSSVTMLTIDNSAPTVDDQNHIQGPFGYGLIYGDTDEIYSLADNNNDFNMSINLTDYYAGVANVTFNMSDICSGTVVTKTSSVGGLWWADCTIDTQGTFEYENVTITTCDNFGNCDTTTHYRTVTLYNYTVPTGETGVMQFGSGTTNLSTETNLEDVNYLLDIELNGSVLTGEPWTGFANAALFNFTSLNFTSPTIGDRLSILGEAIDIDISAPESFGSNRIYVNSSAFAELNTTTIITLYDLPFSAQPNITGDAGAAGGIASITWTSDGNQGNLTFTVDGFSGYNITDNDDPTITFNEPTQGSNTTDTTPLINVTLNGTGTQISQVLFYINGTQIANYTNTSNTANCVNETEGSEIFDCVFSSTLTLSDGDQNLSITTYDYGGVNPGNDASSEVIFTIDSTAPVISSVVNYSITTSSAAVNWTTDENANSTLNYGTTTALGSSNSSTASTTTHSLSMSGLSDGTTYYYNVTSCDSLGNCNTTGPNSFTTLDGTSPGIENVTNTSITSSGVTIAWDTTENANSSVNYGINTSLGTLSSSATLTSSHSISLSSLSASTVYYYNVTSCDSSDNCNTTGTYNFTTSAAAEEDDDDSGSSGGGGGGSSTQQASSNYVKSVWYSIDAGETTVVESENDELGVTKVEFTVSEEVYGGWMKVEREEELPGNIDDLDETVYKFIEITKGTTLEDELLGDIIITFKVLKSWLEDNEISSNEISLFRYNNDEWTELEITFVEDDGEYLVYEAETPGFSYFAIAQGTERTEEEIVTEEAAESEEELGEEVTEEETVAEEVAELGEEEVSEGKEGKSLIWLWAIIIIVVGGLAGWLFYDHKNGKWPFKITKKVKPKAKINWEKQKKKK